jgi:DNA polymerase-3 subunit gamma/tau
MQQSRKLGLDTILAGMDILSTTRGRLQRSNHARTLVEMALVRLGRLGDLVSIGQVAQWLQSAPTAQRSNASTPAGGGVRNAPPEGLKKKSLTAAYEEISQSSKTLPVERSAEDALRQLWAQVLREVGGILATSLEKGGIPAISGPNTLVLRFPAAYNHAYEICAEPANIARIEDKLRGATGKAWSLRTELIRAERAQGTAPPALVTARPPRRNDREEAEKGPLVRRVKDVLGGQIVFAEEGFGLETAPPAAADEAVEVEQPAEES